MKGPSVAFSLLQSEYCKQAKNGKLCCFLRMCPKEIFPWAEVPMMAGFVRMAT